MTKKQTLTAIDRAFTELDGPQDGFSTVRDIMFRMEVDAEKRHRRFTGGAYGLSVKQTAKFWTVTRVAQGLDKPERWSVDDVISVRLECLKAQAYAKRHRAEFLAAFEAAGVTVAEALAWDYSELMK